MPRSLGDGQGGLQSFVHEEIQNLSSLSRICFEATPQTDLFLAMTHFVPPIMKNCIPVNDITMKYCQHTGLSAKNRAFLNQAGSY